VLCAKVSAIRHIGADLEGLGPPLPNQFRTYQNLFNKLIETFIIPY